MAREVSIIIKDTMQCGVRKGYEEVIPYSPSYFAFGPDQYKTQMCIKAVVRNLSSLRLVPDHFKTQEMCEKAVENNPYMQEYVPDQCNTH